MRSRRSAAATALVALSLAACAKNPFVEQSPLDETLLLGGLGSVSTLETGSGELTTFEGVPSADWSTVVSASPDGDGTVVSATDPRSGDVVATAQVPGDYEVRVVSADGSRVAMMRTGDGTQWVPEPRVSTEILVVDLQNGDQRRFALAGNFEPEAFGRHGLFLVRYVPPEAPTAYQVARLDLERGTVEPVLQGGATKAIVETMSGTRLEQAAAPDGSFLFTLYTTAPPASASTPDAGHHGDTHPVGFVHTLALNGGWAHCIGLPERFWGGTADEEAMAVAPVGLLYVVNVSENAVAVLNPKNLRITKEAELDLGGEVLGPVGATLDPEGDTLYVTNGPVITAIDAWSLEAVDRWTRDAPVSALGFSEDGRDAFAVGEGRVSILETRGGNVIHNLEIATPPDVTHVQAVVP